MIVTLTANPSHDRTVTLAGPLERGGVQRAESVTSQAGGKGVNISRAATAAGVESLAVFPAAQKDPFVLDLQAVGVRCLPVCHDGGVRINLTISEPDGTTTKINSPGPTVPPHVLTKLRDALHAHAGASDWVVLAGSLPPGAPVGWYSELVRALGDTGAQLAVDTSDAPLQALVDGLALAAPQLMKPNSAELASVVGADPALLERDPAAAAAAAHVLVDRGVRAVLATLGSRGAVLVTAAGAWHAVSPPTMVVSTVGAGDSSLFGYLMGDLRGLGPEGCLATAVAYGSAAAGLPGTDIPTPEQVHPEQIRTVRLSMTSTQLQATAGG